MATTSKTSPLAALIGNGVLHPKLINRFRVLFDSGNDELDQGLSLQVIAVSPITQQLNLLGATLGSSFDLQVEDDVTGLAQRAVQRLLHSKPTEGMPRRFTTVIEQLDGNETICTRFTFKDCWVSSVTHGELNYAGGASPGRFDFSFPRLDEDLVKELREKESPATQALFTLLTGARISFCDGKEGRSPKVELSVNVCYDDVKVEVLTGNGTS